MRALPVIAGMVLALAPAAAQNFRDGIQASGTDPLARRVLHDFGRCVADRRLRDAQWLLAQKPGSGAYDRAQRRFSGENSCVPESGKLQIVGLLFAGSLAEAILMHEAPGQGWEQRVAYDPALPPYAAHGEADALAACTVRAATVDVRTLFQSEIATDAETLAVRALSPAIQACVKAGTTAKMDRGSLRALLALSAYGLSQSASSKRS